MLGFFLKRFLFYRIILFISWCICNKRISIVNHFSAYLNEFLRFHIIHLTILITLFTLCLLFVSSPLLFHLVTPRIISLYSIFNLIFASFSFPSTCSQIPSNVSQSYTRCSKVSSSISQNLHFPLEYPYFIILTCVDYISSQTQVFFCQHNVVFYTFKGKLHPI